MVPDKARLKLKCVFQATSPKVILVDLISSCLVFYYNMRLKEQESLMKDQESWESMKMMVAVFVALEEVTTIGQVENFAIEIAFAVSIAVSMYFAVSLP